MIAENGKVPEPRTLAFRVIEAGVRPGDGDVFLDEQDLAMIPSGSAQVAVLQSAALAALAIQRLAVVEGRGPHEVLEELWPPKDGR